MSSSTPPPQILDDLIEAVRRKPIPAIDFDTMLAALQERWIEHKAIERRSAVRWQWAVAVAVSFCLGGWFGYAHHRPSTVAIRKSLPALKVIDGRALSTNQELASGTRSLIVDHPGIAHWTLAPGGKARIAIQDKHLTVRLDFGRIDAEVVPSKQPESFAVEVGSLRVAVHGTVFAVEKLTDFLVVTVSEGTVIVGAAGQPGQTSGTVLDALRSERFALAPINDKIRSKHDEYPPGMFVARPKRALPTTAPSAVDTSGSSLTHGEASLNEHPSRVEQEAALDAVRSAAARCFAQAKDNEAAVDSHIIVRVDTQLSITIAPSGAIADISFAPPVPLAILECTHREISGWSAAPSNLGLVASRPVLLMR
jgi:hypothetical protein